MKIIREKSGCRFSQVSQFEAGDAIVMKEPVNQFCRPNDLYVVGEIPPCYLRDAVPERTTWKLYDKVPVINLRTGGVSMVQGDRKCHGRPDATVYPDGSR